MTCEWLIEAGATLEPRHGRRVLRSSLVRVEGQPLKSQGFRAGERKCWMSVSKILGDCTGEEGGLGWEEENDLWGEAFVK